MKISQLKLILTVALSIFLFFNGRSQEFESYQSAAEFKEFHPALKEPIQYEIILPRETELGPQIPRPVIFIFDRQNENNYLYQLQTIAYLTVIGAMPPSVIVGVSFPPAMRTRWTIPNRDKGMADTLLSYLLGPLLTKVKKLCPLSGFNVLIGHSRTAMLAQYSMTAFADKVNAVIGASNSYFDFDSPFQKSLFEQYCTDLSAPGTPRYFFFSSGTKSQGDLHESSVNRLVSYLDSFQLPHRFNWQHYQEPAAHMTMPGLTVVRALNELFSPLNQALQSSFDILNSPLQTDSVPWGQYLENWKLASSKIGAPFPPSLAFFNSIASGYLNDYNNHYKDKKYLLAKAVLLKAMTYYPMYPGFYSFYGSICLETGDKSAASAWNKKAGQLLLKLKRATKKFKTEERDSIRELDEAMKNSK